MRTLYGRGYLLDYVSPGELTERVVPSGSAPSSFAARVRDRARASRKAWSCRHRRRARGLSRLRSRGPLAVSMRIFACRSCGVRRESCGTLRSRSPSGSMTSSTHEIGREALDRAQRLLAVARDRAPRSPRCCSRNSSEMTMFGSSSAIRTFLRFMLRSGRVSALGTALRGDARLERGTASGSVNEKVAPRRRHARHPQRRRNAG